MKSLYHWHGFTPSGKKEEGLIEAGSIVVAKLSLQNQGILVKKIIKERRFLNPHNKKIRACDITFFTQQMAVLSKAGIPLLQALDIIKKSQKKFYCQLLIETLKTQIDRGHSLSDALSKYPAFFNPIYCNLVKVGEKSGTLELMLTRLAVYQEKTDSVKKKIKYAMIYPLTVFCIGILVSVILLLTVIPQFEALFQAFGAKLPALTRGIIHLSAWMQNYWQHILLGLICLPKAFILVKKRFRQKLDRFLLVLPIWGPLLQKASIARLLRTLAMTYAAGLPLADAFELLVLASENQVYALTSRKIRQALAQGQQLHQAMGSSLLFPEMVIQMVAIGEETGALEVMLSKLADFYEEAVDNTAASLGSLLEPLIMSVLGLLVGGLVIAMYLPIFQLGAVV